MSKQQVAAYLRMDVREVVKLASRGRLPCRKVGGEFVFHKGQLDHWVEARIHTLSPDRLAEIGSGVSAHHGFENDELIVCALIPEGGIAVPLEAKTRQAALRALVDLADAAGMVHSRDDLLDEITRREDLCSTALAPGVALPHPRHPLPYDIAGSFVVAGVTPSGIPFGSQDGSLTRLMFLVCGKDERTHLHVLARLALMLHNPGDVVRMLAAEDAGRLGRLLLDVENAIVAQA